MDLLPDRCAQPRQRWNALGMEVELPLLSPFSAMSLSSLLYTKRRTPVGRKARNELQMAVNNCFLPMALICTSSENNGLWPGLYTHSLNEAGCLGWDVSELRTQEPTFARHSSSCMLVCEAIATMAWKRVESLTEQITLVHQRNLLLHGGPDPEELAHFIEGSAEAGG